MKYCVDLLGVEYDPYEFHSSLLFSFISCLKTSDMKYMAIDSLKAKVLEKQDKLVALKTKKKNHSYNEEFNIEESINYFTECIVDIYFGLLDVDDDIKYFHKNYLEKDKEIKEYILLNLLDNFEDDIISSFFLFCFIYLHR